MKRILGALVFLLGLTILGWIGYNLLYPTEGFEFGIRQAIKLIIPISCLFVGWKWMRETKSEL